MSSLIWFTIVSLFTTYIVEASPPPPIHHTLVVEISPETHQLTATDTLRLPPTLLNQTPLSFALNSHLDIDRVELNGQSISISKVSQDPSTPTTFTQWVIEHSSTRVTTSDSSPVITIFYHGQINESPTETGGLRFVRPDKTNGHIGPQGIYLTSETFWYPSWEHYLVTFDLTLTLPSDWQAITQGQETNQSVKDSKRTSQWSILSPTEALTLAANDFVVQKRPLARHSTGYLPFSRRSPLGTTIP